MRVLDAETGSARRRVHRHAPAARAVQVSSRNGLRFHVELTRLVARPTPGAFSTARRFDRSVDAVDAVDTGRDTRPAVLARIQSLYRDEPTALCPLLTPSGALVGCRPRCGAQCCNSRSVRTSRPVWLISAPNRGRCSRVGFLRGSTRFSESRAFRTWQVVGSTRGWSILHRADCLKTGSCRRSIGSEVGIAQS